MRRVSIVMGSVYLRTEGGIHVSGYGTLADEIEVLRACLTEMGIGNPQMVNDLTTMDHCKHDQAEDEIEQTITYIRTQVVGVSLDTISNFLVKNKVPTPVEGELTLDGQLIPLSADEIRKIFEGDDGWDRFRRRYPQSGGIVDFSRVGFNNEATQALVYAGVQVDWLAGRGGYHLFTRKPTGWEMTGGAMAWIS